nr:GNAT family N-acetyltransferase [uncultured Lichenicoccus sp.]
MTDAGTNQPRPARPEEGHSLRRIVDEAYGHYIERMGKAPGPMLDDYSKRIDDRQAWVLEASGAIAGLVVLEDDGQGALLLDNIAVAPSAQGQGIARRLVAFTESEACRRNCRQVRLYTDVLMVENIALYNRLGFRETGRVSEKGFDRVYMAKSVD